MTIVQLKKKIPHRQKEKRQHFKKAVNSRLTFSLNEETVLKL